MMVKYHEPVNLGNPEEYSVVEIAEVVKDIFGSGNIVFEDLPSDDPKIRRPNVDVAKRLLRMKYTNDVQLRLEFLKEEWGKLK